MLRTTSVVRTSSFRSATPSLRIGVPRLAVASARVPLIPTRPLISTSRVTARARQYGIPTILSAEELNPPQEIDNGRGIRRVYLEDIKNNISDIFSKLPAGQKLELVVKANANGLAPTKHGMHAVVEACISASKQFQEDYGLSEEPLVGFVVESIKEAMTIPDCPYRVAILGPVPTTEKNLSKVSEKNFTLTISSLADLKKLEEAVKDSDKQINVFFEINTGANRYGFNPESDEFQKSIQLIERSQRLTLTGMLQHYNSSEDPADSHIVEKQNKAMINAFQIFSDLAQDDAQIDISANNTGGVYNDGPGRQLTIGTISRSAKPLAGLPLRVGGEGLSKMSSEYIVPVSQVHYDLKHGDLLMYSSLKNKEMEGTHVITLTGFANGVTEDFYKDAVVRVYNEDGSYETYPAIFSSRAQQQTAFFVPDLPRDTPKGKMELELFGENNTFADIAKSFKARGVKAVGSHATVTLKDVDIEYVPAKGRV